MSYIDEAYVAEEHIKYRARTEGHYSLSYVYVSSTGYGYSGRVADGKRVLKEALAALESDSYTFGTYNGVPINTRVRKRAVAREFRKLLADFERLERDEEPPPLEYEALVVPGSLTDVPGKTGSQQAGQAETNRVQAFTAFFSGELETAIRLFEDAGDTENVVACKIRQTRGKPVQEQLRLLDGIHKSYHDTQQGKLALYEKAEVLQKSGRDSEAADAFELYVAQGPDGPLIDEALGKLAHMRLSAGMVEEGADYLIRLHEYMRRKKLIDPRVLFHATELLKQTGRSREGVQLLERALNDLEVGRANANLPPTASELEMLHALEEIQAYVDQYAAGD